MRGTAASVGESEMLREVECLCDGKSGVVRWYEERCGATKEYLQWELYLMRSRGTSSHTMGQEAGSGECGSWLAKLGPLYRSVQEFSLWWRTEFSGMQ